ncbi:hypothetical protein FQA39_LY01640 [Lamprigera yunnana]|nr:hypothetical protein FQA39_LY01640 [Lamprigera yunnana]
MVFRLCGDVKCKDYSNRAKKGEQYDVPIGKYRENYPHAGKQEVVKKLNSLRTNFRKELKRIPDAEKSGAGAEDVEPTLWYFEEMRFFQTQKTPTASISTMNISEDVIDVVHDNEDRGDENETNVRTGNDEPRQKKRKGKAPDPTEELVKLAYKRLQQQQNCCSFGSRAAKTVVREEGHQ